MKQDHLPISTPFGCVRDARPADIARIIQMVEKLAEHHDDVPSLTADALTRDAFGPIPWIYVLVAEVGGHLAGYAALCPVIRLQFGQRDLNLHHLFVEDASRGRGIGRALIEGCRLKVRGLSCTSLIVGAHPDNSKAQASYLSHGFARQASYPRPRFSLTVED